MTKKIYENGIQQLTNEEYHASSGLSRSALMRFKRSPYHYWYEYESGEFVKPEPTPALILGDVVHTLVLEPHLYAERYVIMPKFDRRTNAGKADYEAFQLASIGKTIVPMDVAAQATAMAGAIASNPVAVDLLADCVMESSIYFEHKPTGIQLKARPDAWNGSIVVDLKTSLDASFRGFQNSAFGFGYFLQAAFCYEALKSIGQSLEKFVFVVVEKNAPYATAIYVLDDEALEFGVNQFDALMESFSRCRELESFPAYGIQTLTVPNYANYETILEVE